MSDRLPRHTIEVDARCDQDGVAVIAGVLSGRDARPLYADVLTDATSNRAELVAVLEAMVVASSAGWDRVIFRTDSRNAVDAVLGRGRFERGTHDVTIRARRLLRRNTGWTLWWIGRSRNRAAHTLCSQTIKVWRAGQRGEPTLSLEEKAVEAAGASA